MTTTTTTTTTDLTADTLTGYTTAELIALYNACQSKLPEGKTRKSFRNKTSALTATLDAVVALKKLETESVDGAVEAMLDVEATLKSAKKKGRKQLIPGNLVISTVAANPKREGRHSWDLYAAFRVGMTVDQYRAHCKAQVSDKYPTGWPDANAELQHSVRRGHVELVHPETGVVFQVDLDHKAKLWLEAEQARREKAAQAAEKSASEA